MSYNGTVHCRHCYNRGHNRRTCPDLTEQIRARAEGEEGNEGYWGRKYAQRTGKFVDGTSAKELKQGRRDAGQKRRCTYCATKGHNRATCDELKADCSAYVTEAVDFRTRIVADMRERGLGVGCLLMTDRWSEKRLILLDNIRWDSITQHMSNNDVFQGQVVGTSNRRFDCGYPESDFNNHSYHKVDVAGPVAPEALVVPDDFYNEAMLLKLAKGYHKEKRSDKWGDNYYG